MEHITHVTLRSGVVERLPVEALNHVDARRQAFVLRPGARSVSCRPLPHADVLLDALELRRSHFPLLCRAMDFDSGSQA